MSYGITVFHHNDNDGKAAAAVVYKAYIELGKYIDNFISVNYNDSIPTADQIGENDIVYIVDYSFTKATVQNLIDISKKADKVFWFDHHKSSLEIFDYVKENNICKEAIVDTNRCGALITFDYFKEHDLIKRISNYMTRIIELVDDYDRWVHKYPESMLFNIGSQLDDTDPTSDFWTKNPVYAIEDGRIIKEYQDAKNTKLTRNNGFIIKINGHECIVMNTPEASSQAFGEYFDKYKFAIRFAFNGKNFTYSIYSELEDIDCAKIAQRFNPKGGGHKGAAGFTSDKIVFSDQCVFVI